MTLARLVYDPEFNDRYYAGLGVEVRHPFYDRRLNEYLMTVPDDVKRRTDHDKLLLRRSGMLPESVANRLAGGNFSLGSEHALASNVVASTLSGLEIADRGWIRSEAVEASLDTFLGRRGAPPDRSHSVKLPLWMVFALELWYRIALIG